MNTELPSSLRVDWSMTYPPAQPSTSYVWTFEPTAHPLDAELSWPEGTHSILIRAFENRLDRFLEWDLSKVKQHDKPAFTTAAGIFRRGVAVSGLAQKQIFGSYDITFSEVMPAIFGPNDVCIIDKNVADAWSLHSVTANCLILQVEEASKSLATVSKILSFLEPYRSNPKPIYLVGGGILCDTAAFACSMKGLDFNLVPTTLLSMADACVGGKTGVNFSPYGKNQLGKFAFPKEVLVWRNWLNSLPDRELNAGRSECLKHILLSKELPNSLATKPFDSLTTVDLAKIIALKSEVVSRDPTEKGERAILNLGHTLAHALEAYSHKNNPNQPINHGEAVGIGILYSLFLSKHLGQMTEVAFQKAADLVVSSKVLIGFAKLKAYLPSDNLRDPKMLRDIVQYVALDKKSAGQTTRWILLEEIGSVHRHAGHWTTPVEQEDIENTWEDFVSYFEKL
ncbi:MAG: 3-dehydroquinate synthase [Pseudobacteriovorax sp.]|nr:3-dehydroquinate synthase [Pseudobacteriovorax sp.]